MACSFSLAVFINAMPIAFMASMVCASGCPISPPRSGEACRVQDLICEYDLHTCPDGTKQNTTLASCDGTSWHIDMAAIHCPGACQDVMCPADICADGMARRRIGDNCCACPTPGVCAVKPPTSGDICTVQGLKCEYDLHTCPDGTKHNTMLATCDGTMWSTAFASIHCSDVCEDAVCPADICADGNGRRRIGDNCCACPATTKPLCEIVDCLPGWEKVGADKNGCEGHCVKPQPLCLHDACGDLMAFFWPDSANCCDGAVCQERLGHFFGACVASNGRRLSVDAVLV